MRNLKDNEIPTKKYEKIVYEYLNKHYSKEQDTLFVSYSVYFHLARKYDKFYNYPYIVYYCMVEWWKLGFYDIYFDNSRGTDKGTLQWNLLLKELENGYKKN